MPKTDTPSAKSEVAPEEIVCGNMCSWNFRKESDTPLRKTAWDAGTEAGNLVEAFSKATEAAAKDWVKNATCVKPCPRGVNCTKGVIRIGPPEVNGDRNTWVPEYTKNYDSCWIHVEVTCRATVACYCGDDRPHKKEGTQVL